MKEYIYKSLLAGFAIGVAGVCFLASGKLIGAALFGFGLSAVVYNKWILFTGQAGFALRGADFLRLFTIMLICNIAGAAAAALLFTEQPIVDAAVKVASSRLQDGPLECFLAAIGCGFIMTVSVKAARTGQWIPLLLGVPTFVLCGFPHCIADAVYYTASGMTECWWKVWPASVLGNFVGCNLPTLTRWKDSRGPAAS